ncbi:hypothetical protein PTKIN_Ptkin14bG0066400 [Pterospermum kingtungense]
MKPPRPFKLFNFWARHPDFKEVVKASWEQPAHGNPMHVLFVKLKRLKPQLKSFNKMHFSDISRRVKGKKMQLEEVQERILEFLPCDEDLEKEKKLFSELMALRRDEESFFKQESRIQWLQEGDLNTTFFHNIVKAKQKK